MIPLPPNEDLSSFLPVYTPLREKFLPRRLFQMEGHFSSWTFSELVKQFQTFDSKLFKIVLICLTFLWTQPPQKPRITSNSHPPQSLPCLLISIWDSWRGLVLISSTLIQSNNTSGRETYISSPNNRVYQPAWLGDCFSSKSEKIWFGSPKFAPLENWRKDFIRLFPLSLRTKNEHWLHSPLPLYKWTKHSHLLA